MSFHNHPFFLLLLKEVLGYIPKQEVSYQKIPPLITDVTEWYHADGIHPRVSQIVVLFQYQAIAPILKKWKYENDNSAKDFVLSTFKDWLTEIEVPKGSSILPMPLGIDRRMKRWFNQSTLLARTLQRQSGLKLFPWCFRFWSGKHQSTLSKEDRQARTLNFWIPPGISIPKHIVLVDDVISTGSTLKSCAKYLIEKWCKRITIIVLARSS